jgi:hypothetical protein
MGMKIDVALRWPGNRTNMRSEAIGKGLEALDLKVRYTERQDTVTDADLYIQTGFAKSAGIMSAIDKGIPYLIMEAPPFREFGMDTNSSWTYNGLAGGGFRHSAPEEPRPHPTIKPVKYDIYSRLSKEGGVTIFGQKPNDHAIRGTDHGLWLDTMYDLWPMAAYRPHPLMVAPGTLEPLGDCLSRTRTAITFTSTVGVDALCEGCDVVAFPGSEVYDLALLDREDCIHQLSWAQFSHSEFTKKDVAAHIIAGYEEALSLAEQGLYEIPMEKINGAAIYERYYRSRIHRSFEEQTHK